MNGEAPLIRARSLAGLELRQQASPAEVAWLTEHPALWLRALAQMASATRAHISRGHADIRQIKSRDQTERAVAGTPWAPPSVAARQQIQQIEEREVIRRHFLLKVKTRQAEVTTLFGDQAARPLVGEVVKALVEIADQIDRGEPGEAKQKALYWVDFLEHRYATGGTPPDMSH